jgi:hypothetical protein
MTFTTTRLADHRVLVKGNDVQGTVGECVIDALQWDELAQRAQFKRATDKYNATTKAFYATITEAADELEAARASDDPDPVSYIEFEAEQVGAVHKPAQRVTLTHQSQVLRLLSSGQSDRLVWVDGYLEIIDTTAASVSQAIANVEEILGGVEVDEPVEPDVTPDPWA